MLKGFQTNRFGSMGFSILELMCTVAVIGILASLAMPSMPRFGADQHLKAATLDLVMQLKKARSEAVHGHRGANIAPSEIRVEFHGVGPGASYTVYDENESKESSSYKDEQPFSMNYSQSIGPGFNGLFEVVNLVFTPDGKTHWKCVPECTGGSYSSYFSFSMRSENTTSCHTIKISGLGMITSENGGARCEE